MTRVAGLFVALAVFGLCFACGGNSGPTATISPVGTKASTPTPTPEDTGAQTRGDIPSPAEPTLDDALTELASGDHTADLEPGGVDQIDPQTLVEGSPSCTNFELDFTWQVVDPYPPDGVSLQWVMERAGGDTVVISTETSGEQSVGCNVVRVLNNGSSPISVAIKYKIGGLP